MRLRDIAALVEDEYAAIQGDSHSVESVDSVRRDEQGFLQDGHGTAPVVQTDTVDIVDCMGTPAKGIIGQPVASDAALPPAAQTTFSTQSTELSAGSDTSVPDPVPVVVDRSTTGEEKASHLAQSVIEQVDHLGLAPMNFSRVRGLAGELVAGRHMDVFYLELVRALKTGNAAAVDFATQIDALWAQAEWVQATNWRNGLASSLQDNETERREEQNNE